MKIRHGCYLTLQTLLIACVTGAVATCETSTHDDGPKHQKTTGQPQVCTTKACHHRAKLVKSLLNESIDPCDNFYGYVCETWIRQHPIPKDRLSTGTLDIVEEKINRDLRAILEDATPRTKKQNITDKVIVAYRNCLNGSIPVWRRFAVLKRLMKSVGLERWPIWPPTNSTPGWAAIAVNVLYEADINVLFSVAVQRDPENSTRTVLSLDPVSGGYGLHDLDLRNETKNDKLSPEAAAYLRLVYGSIMVYNSSLTKDDLFSVVLDVVRFEKNLSDIHNATKKHKNITEEFTRMKISNLTRMFPDFDWLRYIQDIFRRVNITLTADEEVILSGPDYFNATLKLLRSVNRSTVHNYLGWRMMRNFGPLAVPVLGDLVFNLSRARYGLQKRAALWERCLDSLGGSYGVANAIIGRLYVEKKFPKGAKDDTMQLVENLKTAFASRLRENHWMDDETKKHALEKLEKMLPFIGYDEELFNDTALAEAYDRVGRVAPGTPFLKTYLQFRRNNVEKAFESLHKSYQRNETDAGNPAVANAYYHPQTNSITFPAGILQPPLYEYGLPGYINMGAIGSVIGHEVTHAFDDSGSQFDADGNLRNWWTNETRIKFARKAQCFVDEYGDTFDDVTDSKLNGNKSEGENIADNGGIREAFLAHKITLEKAGRRSAVVLPGLEKFTSDQLFFISTAMVWCSHSRKEQLKNQIKYDAHCPAKYRVNLPLRNLKEFSEAFGCPEGSPMNPVKKCVLW